MLKLVIEKKPVRGQRWGGREGEQTREKENWNRDRNNVTNSSNSNLIPLVGLQTAAHKYFSFFCYVFIAVGLRRGIKGPVTEEKNKRRNVDPEVYDGL